MSVDHKIASEEELAEHVDNISKNIHVDEIYGALKSEFTSYIETNDYASILRVYNQKGTLPQSRLCGLLGISNKESYLNLILSILRENRKDAAAIRTAIKKSLGVS
jgi:hypothetical protein